MLGSGFLYPTSSFLVCFFILVGAPSRSFLIQGKGAPGARQRAREEPVDRAPEDPPGAGLLDKDGRKRVARSALCTVL